MSSSTWLNDDRVRLVLARMSQNYYGYPQQPQNVYQQMGIPQPQPHLNYGIPAQNRASSVIQPMKYSASNPPTSSFPNRSTPQQAQQAPQQQQLQSRPLPA